MIKTVLFDVDGVLINSFAANLRFFQRLMKKAGYTPPTREQYREAFAMNMRDAIKTLTQSESEDEIQRLWQMGKKREIAYDYDLVTLPKGIEQVLEKMSHKFVLGIVTGRLRENAYGVPALAKLKHHFQVTVGYQDTNNHKPHPEPLLFAAKKLKVKPKECIYIGDALSDLQAGHAAGMKFIAYSKTKLDQADATTASFTKIPALVSSLMLK